MKGWLVVLEGIDGSGKRTQCDLLMKSLEELGFRSKIYSFPNYNMSLVGPVIRMMLSGDFGDASKFDPRFVAPLFALDRLESRDEILRNLSDGWVVICDRYSYSNIAHQLIRTSHAGQASLREWIERLEFDLLKLPRADITILLDVDSQLAAARRSERSLQSMQSRPLDDYERDVEGIASAREIYLQLANDLSWNVVSVSGEMSVCHVHSEVARIIFSKINCSR